MNDTLRYAVSDEDDKIIDCSKSLQREFSLQLLLYPFNEIVMSVLNSIENDTLMVLDHEDEDAFSDPDDKDAPKDISRTLRKPVSIREWLSLACQVIRWEIENELDETNKDSLGGKAIGLCTSNAAQVMCPIGAMHIPPGPAAFFGEIIINQEHFPPGNEMDLVLERELKFVIAHELTHAFDMLRFIVPAFENWGSFWHNVLGDGDHCEAAQDMFRYRACFVDDYGSENELSIVKCYWPSKAKEWFDAFRHG